MNNVKPRFNAQMEGTILPLFTDGMVYWYGHKEGIMLTYRKRETVQATCFNVRAALARIVAASRRPK